MVNIIADKEVFEEFLQHHVNSKELSDALERVLPHGKRRKEVEADMKKVVEALSDERITALDHAAKACVNFSIRNRVKLYLV